MKSILTRVSLALAAGALACAHGAILAAEAYPAKPVRLVVPFAAGGSADIIARIVTDYVSAQRGTRFYMDYRPGAGGTLGVDVASKAAPDGYTLAFGTVATHALAPFVFPKLGYEPLRDFTPLTVLVYLPNILTVHPSLPVASVKQLIALAKSHPGALNYASAGVGTVQHLGGAMFEKIAGIRMTHVPYRSGAPAIADLLGGHVTIMFITLPAAVPHIKAGRLRGVAVTSAKRAKALPNVPTIGESLPGYEASTWYGLWFPANTSREMVQTMYGQIAQALKAPEVASKLAASGGEPGGEPPEQFAALIKREQAKWKPIIEQSRPKVQ